MPAHKPKMKPKMAKGAGMPLMSGMPSPEHMGKPAPKKIVTKRKR